ncbi:MAG: type II toxin-antitoxin system RelE/ParE family toxin [Acidobacteriota bacterium]|nr:type II toxin-antitoxin system RelE/ParE family toxin [Acidobacteriota bacterium]
MRVKLHPEARIDLREGKAFYLRRSPLAAVAFAHEIETGISRIAEAPRRYAEGEFGTHEFVLPWRFPYTIVYQIKQDLIVIVAIAHQSKEPAYWSHRT